TPAITFKRVAGIGHQLQFAKNELRCNHSSIKEAGLRDVGNAAVNYDAGVENLVAFLKLLFPAKYSAQRGEVQQVAFVGAYDQANVCHQQHDHDLQKAAQRTLCQAIANHQRKEIRAKDSQNAPDRRTDKPLQAYPQQAPLKHDDSGAEQGAHACVQPGTKSEWMNKK